MCISRKVWACTKGSHWRCAGTGGHLLLPLPHLQQWCHCTTVERFRLATWTACSCTTHTVLDWPPAKQIPKGGGARKKRDMCRSTSWPSPPQLKQFPASTLTHTTIAWERGGLHININKQRPWGVPIGLKLLLRVASSLKIVVVVVKHAVAAPRG